MPGLAGRRKRLDTRRTGPLYSHPDRRGPPWRYGRGRLIHNPMDRHCHRVPPRMPPVRSTGYEQETSRDFFRGAQSEGGEHARARLALRRPHSRHPADTPVRRPQCANSTGTEPPLTNVQPGTHGGGPQCASSTGTDRPTHPSMTSTDTAEGRSSCASSTGTEPPGTRPGPTSGTPTGTDFRRPNFAKGDRNARARLALTVPRKDRTGATRPKITERWCSTCASLIGTDRPT